MLPATVDALSADHLQPFDLFLQQFLVVTALPGRMDTQPITGRVVLDQFPETCRSKWQIPVHSLTTGRHQEKVIGSETAIQMQRVQPFIGIKWIRSFPPQYRDPFGKGGPMSAPEGFQRATEISPPFLMQKGKCRIDIVSGNEFERRIAKAGAGIVVIQGRPQGPQPIVDERDVQKAFPEGQTLDM